MQVHRSGGPRIDLGPSDFVASGGEGEIYARGSVAFKIWTDPAQVPPAAKLKALAALGIPRATLPGDLLTNPAGELVGHTMAMLSHAVPLARLCTRAYRERHAIDPSHALALVEELRDAVAAVHRAGAVVVDLSELNVMTTPDHREIWLVDTASWQVAGFPATAVADHVRDRHAAGGFDTGSDWFSFAVVAFSLLLGLHPYRGRHPQLASLDARMVARVSALRPEVTVPARATYPPSVLPGPWRDWFASVLDGDRRCGPPGGPAGPIQWQPVRLAAPSSPVRASVGLRADAPITVAATHLGVIAAATASTVWVDGVRGAEIAGVRAFGFGRRTGAPVAARIVDRRLVLCCARSGRGIPVSLEADAVTGQGGRLLVLGARHLVEVELHEVGAAVVAAPRTVAEVLPWATRLHDGIATQDALGAAWVSWFPVGGGHRGVRVAALDGVTVIGAQGGPQAALLSVATDAGPRMRFVRSDAAGGVDVLEIDEAPHDVDFAELDTGTVVLRRGDGLEIWRSAPGDRRMRPVPGAPGGRLVALGSRLGIIDGDTVSILTLA